MYSQPPGQRRAVDHRTNDQGPRQLDDANYSPQNSNHFHRQRHRLNWIAPAAADRHSPAIAHSRILSPPKMAPRRWKAARRRRA